MTARSEAAPAIVWLRDDLRLADNPALAAAAAGGRPLLVVYILDDISSGLRPLGGATRWWLHGALASLGAGLQAIGGRLDLLAGEAAGCLDSLAAAAGAGDVFWNRRYAPAEVALDTRIKAALQARGLAVHSFSGHLLHEPWEVRPKSGGFFKVFTPFLRAAEAAGPPPVPLPSPPALPSADYPAAGPPRVSLDDLRLRPTHPDWAAGLRQTWRPGEPEGRGQLQAFVTKSLHGYATGRDQPAADTTSRLSAFLRFGAVSVRQAYHAAEAEAAAGRASRADVQKFHAELRWRDFAYNLLFHVPEFATRHFKTSFEHFPWLTPNAGVLHAWQQGRTGYPIVDAGMRELWRTGFMQNRVRLVTASFLVKHLLTDWRVGEAWFWDTLCDADPASNATNWQWVAGSGPDAAPYFRVFNPVLQGEKFDPDGAYVRANVPELAQVPARWIHQPWRAPKRDLAAAGVVLGDTYPLPIVDHDAARERALAAFAAMRSATA